MSDVFDLADAVAARVNGGSYSLGDTFTATGLAMIEMDADELVDNVIVHCVPRAKTIEPLSRSKDRTEVVIGVGVLKTVGTVAGAIDTDAVDALVEFCEDIADRIRSESYTINGRRATWLGNEIDPIYDPDALYASQQFRSVVNATYLMTTP